MLDLSGLNVRSFFESVVESHPNRTFLVFADDGRRFSYRAADDLINRAAAAWHSLGVTHGDRVAFMVDNSPEFVWAWLGLAKLGGVLVAINTGFREAEASYVIQDSGAVLAYVDESQQAMFKSIADEAPLLRGVLSHGSGEGSFDELMSGQDPVAPPADLGGDDVISLIYTSGTTGHPKGVVQTHRNYVLTGQAYPSWMRMSLGERIYACLPLFHINSQAYSTMGAIGASGTLVLASRFSARRFWPDVRRYGVHVFNFIGAMAVILSKSTPGEHDAENSVHTAYGVPALPAEVVEDVERRFGMRVISGFGMSETTFGLLEPIDEPRRPGTMGRPRHHPDPSVPRTQAKVIDDDGAELAVGEIGELALRNAAMMSGYFNDPERTAEALVDGWLRTGDSVYRDADEFFYFVDRKKDIVRRRGENISSLEVERVVELHPAVLEAAAIGVPAELSDEDLLVYVVIRDGYTLSADEVFDWAAARLAPFKVPSYVRFTDDLPKTPTSKIQKQRLRELDASTPAARVPRPVRRDDRTTP